MIAIANLILMFNVLMKSGETQAAPAAPLLRVLYSQVFLDEIIMVHVFCYTLITWPVTFVGVVTLC